MTAIIVPLVLKNAIHAAITEKAKAQPEIEKYRNDIYLDLLDYYNEHGEIPDFDFEASAEATVTA